MAPTEVKLTKRDVTWLKKHLRRRDICNQERNRAQILLLSHKGFCRQDIVDALETSTPTISRTRKKFRELGVEEAVLEKTGARGAPAVLDVEDEQIIACIACSEPPAGYSKWTVRLIMEQASKRGVPKVSLETLRLHLKNHAIRP